MNNLGGMVFIVAGIAMGYWIVTGRAKNFLYALRTGQQPPQINPNDPGQSAIWQSSAGGWGQGTPPATQTPVPLPQARLPIGFTLPNLNVPQNIPYNSGNW